MVFLHSFDNMFNQKHSNLQEIDTYFEPLLNRLLSEDRLGIGCGIIKVDSISSSCGKTQGDCFKLSIPYANHTLSWNVLFDSQYPELGPDFVFGDETFLIDPDIDNLSMHVPTLAKWDCKNDNALLKVIMELLSYYKQHQVQMLEKKELGQRLILEYRMLIDDTKLCPKDIEVILLPLGIKPAEACFSIRLDIDFSQLPNRINQSQNDAAMLKVTFRGQEWGCIIPYLYLSKSLEETFSGSASLHIPPISPNTFLTAYIPTVKKLIVDKINTIVYCFETRKSFVSTLLTLQRDCIIEYDAVEFYDITLLLENRDFYFLVHFHLSPTFPKDRPTIKLQSVYHMTAKGTLYTQTLDNCIYSPQWSPRLMISKILTYIIDNEVTKFKENSTKNNRFCNK